VDDTIPYIHPKLKGCSITALSTADTFGSTLRGDEFQGNVHSIPWLVTGSRKGCIDAIRYICSQLPYFNKRENIIAPNSCWQTFPNPKTTNMLLSYKTTLPNG